MRHPTDKNKRRKWKERKKGVEEGICVRLGVVEREGQRWEKKHICLWMCKDVWACARSCVCARGHRHREERIWQACLLSPQNNCLWITWGESHWRHLEMTLPGDSLNHVHIRSEAFCFGCVCAGPCVWIFVRLQIRGEVLSFISLTSEWNTSTTSEHKQAGCEYTSAKRRLPLLIYHLWLSSIPHGKSWRANDRNISVQILMTSGTSRLVKLEWLQFILTAFVLRQTDEQWKSKIHKQNDVYF